MPYRPDLGELRHPDPHRPDPAWRISPGLDPGLRASRFTRPPEPGLRDAVRASVHPGDAADANAGGKPTGRAMPAGQPVPQARGDADGGGRVFLVKVRGTDDCCDGDRARAIGAPLPLTPARWHGVHILLRASQVEGRTALRVWLDGRACARHRGRLGYIADGMRDAEGAAAGQCPAALRHLPRPGLGSPAPMRRAARAGGGAVTTYP